MPKDLVKLLSRFAIVLNMIVGGLWFLSFLDHPDWLSVFWVIFPICLILVNIPGAKLGELWQN